MLNPWRLGGSFMVQKMAMISPILSFKGDGVGFGDSFCRTV